MNDLALVFTAILHGTARWIPDTQELAFNGIRYGIRIESLVSKGIRIDLRNELTGSLDEEGLSTYEKLSALFA